MKPYSTFFLVVAGMLPASGNPHTLTISESNWSPGSPWKPTPALLINQSLPGPVLRFREGDHARIEVRNALKHESTSIHWHGLLVPNSQDGVPGVTTAPIPPGGTLHYEFPIRQSGTYWYHSHSGLQEQRGVYGAIVIEPRGGESVKTDRDYVVLLSDWTRERPERVMNALMRGSEWYALRKGTIQSLSGAWRAGAMAEFWERERSRMPAMDVSDVAYDAFLANGKTTLNLPALPGETVRLRFINAGSATNFHLQSATGKLRVIAADGPAVKPLDLERLFIAMAETYDVTVRIPSRGSWEVRATSQDGSGHASVLLGSGTPHPAPDIPRPDNYRMDSHLMAFMESTENPRAALRNPRPISPYPLLQSTRNTRFPAHLPRRSMELRLTGDMARYLWSFNGKTISEDGVIRIRKGEVLRLELVNDTMMHHPLHLHGHFFRVIESNSAYAPLKHTVDVPPMGRRTIEFEADEQGDWLFHCHLLYHMHSGMARVFSYEEQGPEHQPNLGEHAQNPLYAMLDVSLQSHMSMGMFTLMNQRNDFFASWDLGMHHSEDGDHEIEYEADIGWKHYLDPNLYTQIGYRFTNQEDQENRLFAGIDYRLPYLIRSSIQIDSEGDARLELSKSLRLTDHLSWFGSVRYDTGSQWEWTTGAEYLLNSRLSLITQYHSDHGWGGGIRLQF